MGGGRPRGIFLMKNFGKLLGCTAVLVQHVRFLIFYTVQAIHSGSEKGDGEVVGAQDGQHHGLQRPTVYGHQGPGHARRGAPSSLQPGSCCCILLSN